MLITGSQEEQVTVSIINWASVELEVFHTPFPLNPQKPSSCVFSPSFSPTDQSQRCCTICPCSQSLQMAEPFSNPYYNSLLPHVARETWKEIVVLFSSKQQRNYFYNSLIDFTNALQFSIISLSLVEVAEYQFGSFTFCYLSNTGQAWTAVFVVLLYPCL